MVRALASHPCGLGSNPAVDVICGLGLLLVLDPAPRVFRRILRFSSLHKNQHFQEQFDLETVCKEPLCGYATANSHLLFIYFM